MCLASRHDADIREFLHRKKAKKFDLKKVLPTTAARCCCRAAVPVHTAVPINNTHTALYLPAAAPITIQPADRIVIARLWEGRGVSDPARPCIIALDRRAGARERGVCGTE